MTLKQKKSFYGETPEEWLRRWDDNEGCWSIEMGGMVTVVTGNNSWAGGDNDADGGLSIHVAGATLTVDGQTLVAGGSLAD